VAYDRHHCDQAGCDPVLIMNLTHTWLEEGRPIVIAAIKPDRENSSHELLWTARLKEAGPNTAWAFHVDHRDNSPSCPIPGEAEIHGSSSPPIRMAFT
jgi:hypothetical protein